MRTRNETSFRPAALVGLALVLPAVVAGCGSGGAESARAATAVVERGDLRIVAEATGTIEPIRKIEVKSKASGEVVALHVDVGDQVEPGTLLAEVDPRDVRNRHEQVKADLDVTEERYRMAERNIERQEQLHEAGVITEQELESARLDFANAEASLIKARTNMELAELQLNDVTIRAPLAGTILVRNVEEGTVIQSASQNVSGGTVLFTMASLDAMRVRTLVDETDMGELRPGMGVTVTVEAYPEREFPAFVARIEPQAVVQQNVTMFPVIVHLANETGLLKPGMNAEVEILIDEAEDVLLIQNNAIVNTSDVEPAAMVLGLDVGSIDFAEFQRAGRFGGRLPGAEPAGPDGRADEAANGDGDDPSATEGDREGRPGTDARTRSPDRGGDDIRARIQRGELSVESLRALGQNMRRSGGAGGMRGRGGGGVPGAAERRARRAVVFVVPDSLSAPEPRLVEIGLNDWDRTQIVSGLEEGDRVAIVGAAQLQAQQQEFLDRRRQRRGNSSNPFGR